ncbi:MAG: flagellar export chaperone FliS [bacterium]
MSVPRTPNPAARAYKEMQVLTASPAERLIMTYDGALRAADAARTCALNHDKDGERREGSRLTQFLLFLMRSVDPAPDPVMAERLLTLYQWCLARLANASREGPAVYSKIGEVLGSLRSAFAQTLNAS